MLNKLYACIDLGSNSFRLLVARTINTAYGSQIIPVLNARQGVALASGLDTNHNLDEASIERAINAFNYFKHKLSAINIEKFFIVATSTFRSAKNINLLIEQGQKILGAPIHTIDGLEEARLIYLGASHTAPYTDNKRLVIDIGGGSTELIIGHHHKSLLINSLNIGCINLSQLYFTDGYLPASFDKSIIHVINCLEKIIPEYINMGWEQIVGSSGTARILAYIASQIDNKQQENILTFSGLELIKNYLIECKNIDNIKLKKINKQRLIILAGGLSIMLALFKQMNIKYMHVCEGGLRFGVLYENLDTKQFDDIRYLSVQALQKRFCLLSNDSNIYNLLLEQAKVFTEQLNISMYEEQMLTWALQLYNIGSYISTQSIHKHSSYIVQNSIMNGFCEQEQYNLSQLILAQKGNLTKVEFKFIQKFKHVIFILRLCLLLFKQSLYKINKNKLKIQYENNQYIIESYAEILVCLIDEQKYWQKININFYTKLI